MTDKAKRHGFMVLAFWRKNKHSTKLHKLLDGLAKNGDQKLTGDQLTEMRETAEDLKFSIDGGKTLDAEKLARLDALDRGRYEMATKVLDSMKKSVKNEQETIRAEREEKQRQEAQEKAQKENKAPARRGR